MYVLIESYSLLYSINYQFLALVIVMDSITAIYGPLNSLEHNYLIHALCHNSFLILLTLHVLKIWYIPPSAGHKYFRHCLSPECFAFCTVLLLSFAVIEFV